MEYTHRPVLLSECLDALNIKPDGVYIDGTLGRAGHSREIVTQLQSGRLIAIDRDLDAVRYAESALSAFGSTFTAVQGDFADLPNIMSGLELYGVDGMLFDLGVSSPQLDDASRGFSYMVDAPLDMRMDRDSSKNAYDVVNGYSPEELKRIFYEYGEERYSASIVSKIVKERSLKPIESTLELVDIIRSAMPAKALREKQHPAKRCFQALRIEVNGELDSLKSLLDCVPALLNSGGRIAVISFHSLEDRIVKRFFRGCEDGCTCPKSLPLCVCGFEQSLKVLTRSPITATQEEINVNPRARSAKLRVAERLERRNA